MHCMLKASLYFIWPFGVIVSLQLVTVIQIFFVQSTKFLSLFFFPPEIKMFILNCQITRSTNFISSINAEDISD